MPGPLNAAGSLNSSALKSHIRLVRLRALGRKKKGAVPRAGRALIDRAVRQGQTAEMSLETDAK